MKNEKLKQLIIDYNKNNFTNFNEEEETIFIKEELLKQEIISINQQGQIKKLSNSKLNLGKLRMKKKFGFVSSENTEYYCHHIKGFLDEDYVLVLEKDFQKGSSKECQLIALVDRKENFLIGKKLKNGSFYIMNEKYQEYKFKVKNPNKLEAYEGQIFKIKVDTVSGWTIHGLLDSLIADSNDPDLSMKLVLSEFSIQTEFTENTHKEVKKITENPITPEDVVVRRDLREDLTMTIDGADAKDLDDAISLIKEGTNYRLKVSIADVSHYIKPGSAIDTDGFSRATSVYFVDRVVPMLPKEISNGICSLHPKVDRLTMTCEMVFDPDGEIIDYKIYESIIHSKYRMTYENVNKMLVDNDPEVIKEYSEIYGTLKEMNKLAKIINKKKIARGSFNLEDKEPVFTVNEEGKIEDIGVRVRQDAEKLIEEFMIVANETVAQHISYLELPSIYRVHGQPSINHIKELFKIFPLFGITLKGNSESFHSSSFKVALDAIEDPLKKRIISDIIVRSMQKAEYAVNNIGHFGLASRYYTHFTSPIRRYPDLQIHRILKSYVISQKFDDWSSETLAAISVHSSEKEVSAIKAEQKIEDQKKAEYMKQFIGQEFKGTISSIVEFGMFIELENTQRGLIRFRQLEDFVQAINYKVILKNKQSLQIGQTINVRLVGVNIDRGLVDFEPVDLRTKEIKPDVNYHQKQKSISQLRNSEKVRSGDRPKRNRNKGHKRKKHES